ncbi:MAG: hypothetical protein JXX14_08150 [Deltaproteobacteria bacterium]|nr:hypothetical protein [Deltaproteobacteria bacterium]
MSGLRTVAVSAVVAFFCVMIFPWHVAASQKRCPVCHEVFDEDVNVCPNDGTDLKLLGDAVPDVETQGDDLTVPDANDAVDDSATAVPDEGRNPDVHDGLLEDTHKYIRHDQGGRRRRIEQDGSTEWDERSDRLRRLHDERAGAVSNRKKEILPEFDARQDAALRALYLQRRQNLLSVDEAPPRRTVHIKAPLDDEEKALWEKAAPLVSIGTRLSLMGEARQPGPLVGAEIDLNMLRSNIRVGLSSFIGVRYVSRNELMFLESFSIGVQRPWRYSPYISGRFGIGGIVSYRFGENVLNRVRGLGVDAGVDCHVSHAVTITPAVGYVRYAIERVTWDSVAIKIALGF